MEDIVLSGISGRLPESDNLEEFWEHLMNKDNLVTQDNRRWEPGLFGLPRGNGKMKDLSRFDATFFGVHAKQANTMDPQLRMLLEVSYEAIIDAGVDPQTLRGTNTGVYIGCSGSEATQAFANDPETLVGYSITGTNRTMLANRVSYVLDFKGPSYAVDTACSSSFLALHLAMQDIRQGLCDAAIVGGVSMLLKPQTSLQFLRLGVLSPDGLSKSFDSSGNGYCRSEAIVSVFITKKSLCKRAYCDLVNSGTNTDGYKEQGITFPSGPTQTSLVRKLFEEAGIKPNEVEYFEAHGTGTKVGDPEEVNGIASMFCQDRTPEDPLLVGSIKSNMGHSEASSGLAALAKVVLMINKGIIPPNIHFESPNPDITAIVDGRMKVVTEPTDYRGGYVGVNSFGFGGSNVHVIVRPSRLQPATPPEESKIPRLVTCAGRTEEAVTRQLEHADQHSSDQEFLALMDGIAYASAQNMLYRGYAILGEKKEDKRVEEVIKVSGAEKRPLWYVFSGMGSQWPGMGRDLMVIDTFHDSIERSHRVIQAVDKDVDVYRLLTNGHLAEYNTTLNNFVGIASIQVALVDCLKELGLEPEGIIGHSVGELGCAYADGGLTAEETVLAAYWRGRCVRDAKLPTGAMAAVGLTWEEAKQRCPKGTLPACHNTEDTVTISGEVEPITKFVENLKEEGIFAKMVDSSGVAYHSPFMASIAPLLKAALVKVITDKPRTSRWISTSIPESNWGSELAQTSSAAYHVNNLVSPVLFKEGLAKIPDNAVTIEIGPHCLLQAILKRDLSTGCEFTSLMNRKKSDNLEYFLSNVGKLYLSGIPVQVSKLYPEVKLPVSIRTPCISPAIGWDHSQEWDVPTAKSFLSIGSGSATVTSYTIDASPESPDHYVLGHCIDGRVLYPATGYLCLAWRALARMNNTSQDQLPVEFKDVAIHQATIMPSEGTVTLEVRLAPASNTFEIAHGEQLAVSGKIFVPEEPLTVEEQTAQASVSGDEGAVELSTKDAYKELRLRGYEYGGLFQGIVRAKNDGSEGTLSWQGNWVSFIDTMLQISILQKPGRALQLPTRIRRIAINPSIHPVLEEEQTSIEVPVIVNKTTSTCQAGGVQIQGMHATVAPRRHGHTTPPTIEQYTFVPYNESSLLVKDNDLLKYHDVCSGYLEQTLIGVRERFAEAGLEVPDVRLVAVPGGKKKDKVSSEILDQYLNDPKCGYLQLLHSICNLKATNKFGAKVEQLKADNAELLANDILLKALLKGPHLKNCLDIVWENVSSPKLKIIELGAASGRLYTRVIPLLNSQPTTQLDYTAADTDAEKLSGTAEKLESLGAKVAEWNIATSSTNGLGNADLIVADSLRTQSSDIHTALSNIASSLKDRGFLLVHDVTIATATGSLLQANNNNSNKKISTSSKDQQCANYLTEAEWVKAFDEVDLEVVAQKSDGILSSLFLCRKRIQSPPSRVISVSDRSLKWVEEIKDVLVEDEDKPPSEEKIWLVADGDQYSGVVGFANCLAQEPGGERIRCIFNASLDSSSSLPDIASGSETMKLLDTKDLLMNVYRDGEWGSFRHSFLKIDPEKSLVHTTHAFANVLTRGDLSTLSWIASPLTYLTPSRLGPDQTLCTVYYASLNFRDIMLATGKLPPDALPAELAQQDNILGLEFSGRNQDGRRIMGLVHSNSLATTVTAFKHLLFDVPDNWSLEDAATVPVVYSTAYYALVVRGQLRKGETVLIHSGSGGVGQAAIAIALSYGCRVFTTVGTPEKRAFLKHKFSQLTDDCFANSRDLSFEPQILNSTNGKGVDVVLNSLAAEKLEASLRVLAVHGRFLEIGKYDLSQNTGLGMALFLRNTSFHGVHLDRLMDADNPDWPTVAKLLQDGIASGVVTPLKTTVFEREEVETAFRFMAQGKHIGKVLIKVREEEKELVTIPSERKVLAVARNTCHPDMVYIITGGLGGFGLELANWLVDRGAKKLVLTSRSGVKTGYQAHCVARWQSQGVEVIVSKRDVCHESEAKKLIEEALNKGPVGGIFNLAVVLKDGFFENQTPELFQAVCAPKRDGTIYLDRATRQLCGPELEWFVMFSSVSCGRGNPGQTNYGFANSTMERVCEKRRHDGLAGLAVQWGVIGDVGVAMETMGGHDVVVSGCVAQRMSSCLSVLDAFLSQPNAVVSSFVPAEKASSGDQGAKLNLVDSVAHILGVTDSSSLSRDATLGDLGLDSLMGVEVKQTLERDYNITMNMREIRQLTMHKLDELSAAEGAGAGPEPGQNEEFEPTDEDDSAIPIPMAHVSMVIPHNEAKVLVKLNDVTKGNPVYFLHPLEGTITPFESLASKIKSPCYALQCSPPVPSNTIPEMAAFYLQTILSTKPSGPIKLVGYSYGACVAFEMALQLQQSGKSSVRAEPLIFIDGSPDFLTIQTTQYINQMATQKSKDGEEVGADVACEVGALCAFIEQLVHSNMQELMEDLNNCKDQSERIAYAITKIQKATSDHTPEDLIYSAKSLIARIKASYKYQVESQLLGDVIFLRATHFSSVMRANKLEEDYGLKKICKGTVTMTPVKGDHSTILRDEGMQTVADVINGS